MATRVVAASARRAQPNHRAWNGLFVGLSVVHALALLTIPSIPLIAIGQWWHANTIAHNFIHRPFFRSRWWNRAFSLWTSLLLGIPQTYWRVRHLAHHRDAAHVGPASHGFFGVRRSDAVMLAVETCGVLLVWCGIAAIAPHFFFAVYVPGYLAGLALCFLQGHYEHAGGTTSCYGRIYNLLFFNDGYHDEHHRRPGAHWTELPRETTPASRQSGWPPVLRWMDAVTLDALERVVLHSPTLQRFVLSRHERAFRKAAGALGGVSRVTIVGGGLFPRTALILRKLVPHAALTIVDSNGDHLAIARTWLDERVRLVHASYDPASAGEADLVIIPLAYRGDRRRIYVDPPAPVVLVHDWMWARWPRGTRVSWLLLKRLNVVCR